MVQRNRSTYNKAIKKLEWALELFLRDEECLNGIYRNEMKKRFKLQIHVKEFRVVPKAGFNFL